ncbi:hypothetical protein ARSEF4850_009757 [Beauveria asiatica]
MTLCVGGLGSTHAVVERTQTTDLQAAKVTGRDEMPKRHSKVWAAEAVPSLQADEADEQGRAAEATLEGVGGRGSTHTAVEGERPKRHSKIWAAEAAPNLQSNEADKQERAAEATLESLSGRSCTQSVGGRGSTHAAVEGERPKRHSKIWAAEAAPNLQANEADKQGRAAEATL